MTLAKTNTLNSDKTFELLFLNFQIQLIYFKNIYKAYFLYNAKQNVNINNAYIAYRIQNTYNIHNLDIYNIYDI